MEPRTPQEIAQEIHDLKALRPRLELGSANYEAITAQVVALQTYMLAVTAHDAWGEPTQLETLTAALEAVDWRDGRSDERPSVGWLELLDD